jgi:hypothetical protein
MTTTRTTVNDMFLQTDLNEPLQTTVLHHGRPHVFGGVIAFWNWCKGTQYRVTNRGVEIKSGLVLKTVDNIELWRVRDIRFVQSSLCDCCCTTTGTLILYPDDPDYSEPEYKLYGIKMFVYDALKEYLDQIRYSGQQQIITTTKKNNNNNITHPHHDEL